VDDPYQDREQTKAKHFLLKRYLQALAFKILNFSDLTYIDGFSGPWKTKTENFTDSSFMIAINALKDAQQKIFEKTGKRRRIGCFFSETNSTAFAKLQEAVSPYHRPQDLFEIKSYFGKFENAVGEIRPDIHRSNRLEGLSFRQNQIAIRTPFVRGIDKFHVQLREQIC